MIQKSQRRFGVSDIGSALAHLVALGAGGDDLDGAADVLLQELHIGLGVLGQIRVIGDAADVALPTGQLGEHGLCAAQLGGHGEDVSHFAVDLIAGADRDLVQIAQHVQAGQGNLSGALHHAAVLSGHGIEPAHTAGTAGGGTELALVTAPAAQLVTGVAQNLAHERLRLGTHAGGVSLGDADDILNGGGGHAGAYGAEAGQRVAGGGHGADAQIGILHAAQLALQQDCLALLERLVDKAHRVAHIGTDQPPGACDRGAQR